MLFIEEAARNKNFSQQLPASSKFATQAGLIRNLADCCFLRNTDDKHRTHMEEQDRKEQWAQLLPKNLQQDSYGLLTPADVIAASEKDRDAYLNKYWPDLEERMLVQSLLKGKIV